VEFFCVEENVLRGLLHFVSCLVQNGLKLKVLGCHMFFISNVVSLCNEKLPVYLSQTTVLCFHAFHRLCSDTKIKNLVDLNTSI
jgi:hypothetical protein